MKKIIVLLLACLLAASFFYFDLQQWLTLAGLKSGLDQLLVWRDENWLFFVGFYGAAYIIVTALSLPGAAVMTLAGGALFGLWWGLLIVSFASTIGATLAFLVSRFLLQSTVQNRFGERLSTINKGIQEDGAFYLFTLRLVPVFPFFLINLLMALTPIKTFTFYWVSQIGMLAGTAVFVNAGTQLAEVDSLSDVLSPSLLLSFVLLGVFPLLAKQLLAVIKKRRVYASYTKPKHFDRNIIVIGAGAGGLVTSYIAALVKAKVTLVENHKMGGDCLNTGCVPSKALIKSAKIADQMRNADQYGLEPVEPKLSFRAIMTRIKRIIADIEPHDSVERYTSLGVEVIQGYARLMDPWTVEITLANGNTQTLTSRSIVLATGAKPLIPPLPGLDDVGYVTSDTLWDTFSDMDQPPARLVVLGGGPIGCELAQSFSRLGSQVTQIEMSPRLLIREDEEVSESAKMSLERSGVNVLTNHRAIRCGIEETESSNATKYIVVENGGAETIIPFDALLCAVGRHPRLQGYGLETLGIDCEKSLPINAYLQTQYPNIFAVGDLAGPYQFTHVAAHQAWYGAVNGLFGDVKKFKVDYRVIPTTTFLDPEIARVGLNETEAKAQGVDYEVVRYNIDDLDRAIADSKAHGYIRVLTPPGKDKILGVTIVAEGAGEMLTEFTMAMKHGLGLKKILATIHVYPTWAEANKYAAGEWSRRHAPEKLLPWVARFHQWRRGQ